MACAVDIAFAIRETTRSGLNLLATKTIQAAGRVQRARKKVIALGTHIPDTLDNQTSPVTVVFSGDPFVPGNLKVKVRTTNTNVPVQISNL